MKTRSLGLLLLLVLGLLLTAAAEDVAPPEASAPAEMPGEAASEAPPPEETPMPMPMDERAEKEIYDLVMRLYVTHLSAHEAVRTSDMLTATDGEYVRGKYPVPPQETALGCINLGYGVSRGLPANESAMRALLQTTIDDAYLIQQAVPDAQFVQDGDLSFSFPEAALWWYGPFADGKLIIAPLMLERAGDAQGMYFLVALNGANASQVWICADQAAVYDCYAAMDWQKDTTGYADAARAWMAEYAEANATPVPTETPEPTVPPATPTPAPTPMPEGIIGEVTVGEGRVNIRDIPSTMGAIIGRAAPGSVLGCFGEIGGDNESRWFDVLLPDGSRGYMPAGGGTLTAQ